MEYNAHVCCLVGVLDLAGDLLLLRTRPLLRLWLGERREADRDLFIASPDTSKEKVTQMPQESYDAHTGINKFLIKYYTVIMLFNYELKFDL